jgi:hypothetical protein
MKESPAPAATMSRTRVMVRIGLFATLGMCLAAAAYEFLYARAQCAGFLTQIEDLDKKKNAFDEPTTDVDVQKLIGFPPLRENRDRDTLVERYVWTSVVPGRKHELWVLYLRGLDDRWLHMTHGMNSPPELILDEEFLRRPASNEAGPRTPLGPEPPQAKQDPASESEAPENKTPQNNTTKSSESSAPK